MRLLRRRVGGLLATASDRRPLSEFVGRYPARREYPPRDVNLKAPQRIARTRHGAEQLA